MRYGSAQYAEALQGALKGKKETEQQAIVRRFAAVLARHRMLGKADAILAAYEKLTLRAQGARRVKIESASPASDQLKKDIRKILGAEIYFEEKENADLLAGVKILIDDELLIDASGRRQVDRMLSGI